MSGLSQMLFVSAVSPPAPALSVGASVIGGSVPVHVNAASGSTAALPGGGGRLFTASASGGTPPYTYRWTRQNGENKTFLINSDERQAYVEWSGMIVGEYQSTTARCRVTDNAGASATSGTIVIGVQRDA